MPKRKHVLLPLLLLILVAAAAALVVRGYAASTYSVLPTSDSTAGFENTLIATPGDGSTSLTGIELAKEINTIRTEKKVTAFTINQNLMDAAGNLAVSYIASGRTSVNDTDWANISAAGYQYASANILSSSAKIVTSGIAQGFFNGASTRETLMSDVFQDVGVAVVEGTYNGEQTNVIVLVFGAPAPNYSPVPYNESTANGAIPSTGGSNSGVSPATCNEALKASYKQSYDNDKKAADAKLASDLADINTRYPQQSPAKQSAIDQANTQHDTSVAAAYSSYTSSLKSVNCTP